MLWFSMIAYALLRFGSTPDKAPATSTSAQQDTIATYGLARQQLQHAALERAVYLLVLVFVSGMLAGVFMMPALGPFQRALVALIGMLTVASLLVIQERVGDERDRADTVARDVATRTGTHAVLEAKEPLLLSTPNALRLLHIGIGALWLLVLG